MIRIFDYIGVQDYLANAMMGEITNLVEAKKFYEECLEWLDDVKSFEEITEIYEGDIDKIKFSLKCNYIDSFLYDPRSMEEEIEGDTDIKEDLLDKGLIGEDEEGHYEPELRVLWTSWLDKEYEMESEKREEYQKLFTDIKKNFWRMAYWKYAQDKLEKYKNNLLDKKKKTNGKGTREHICPICGGPIGTWQYAVSRVDNETIICSGCGAMEACVQFGFKLWRIRKCQ